MHVSLCLLTIDRHDTTQRTLAHNFARAKSVLGNTYELLHCDNGSTDRRVIDLVRGYNPVYERLNSKNEGVARAQNQLLLRASGDALMLFPNDILMPDGWLDHLCYWHDAVKDAGLVGMQCTEALPPLSSGPGRHGGEVQAHFLDANIDKVFGPMFFGREVLEKVGGLCERFHPYAFEDSDLNNRVTKAAFNSFYIPGLKTEHLGGDVGQSSDYRRMKDAAMSAGLNVLGERIEWCRAGNYYERLPEFKEPI